MLRWYAASRRRDGESELGSSECQKTCRCEDHEPRTRGNRDEDDSRDDEYVAGELSDGRGSGVVLHETSSTQRVEASSLSGAIQVFVGGLRVYHDGPW